MLRLNLTAEPRWLDLAAGRAPARRAAHHRADGGGPQRPAPSRPCPTDRHDEERAAGLRQGDRPARGDRLGGRRRRRRQPVAGHARRASTRCSRSGRSSRRSRRDYVAEGPAAGRGKKRLRALADWHFGGGDRYCAACAKRCPDCPARLNRPQTPEGWQVWDLVGRLGGQLRVIPGAVIGWDMGAALALAAALGIDALVAAELLPEIEAVMVRRLNEAIGEPRWLKSACPSASWRRRPPGAGRARRRRRGRRPRLRPALAEMELANARLAGFARKAGIALAAVTVAAAAAGVAMVRSGLETIDAQAKMAQSLKTTVESLQVLTCGGRAGRRVAWARSNRPPRS